MDMGIYNKAVAAGYSDTWAVQFAWDGRDEILAMASALRANGSVLADNFSRLVDSLTSPANLPAVYRPTVPVPYVPFTAGNRVTETSAPGWQARTDIGLVVAVRYSSRPYVAVTFPDSATPDTVHYYSPRYLTVIA